MNEQDANMTTLIATAVQEGQAHRRIKRHAAPVPQSSCRVTSVMSKIVSMPAAPALLARMRARLMDRLVRYLTGPIKHSTPATTAEPRSLAAILNRGDVLLSEGNTRVAALVKRITRSPWSHVSMYVGPLEDGPDPLCIVEADIAGGVRSIRLSELNALHVRVLRPHSMNDTDRCRLADWVVGRIGSEYDLAHLLRLSLPMRIRSSPHMIANSTTRFICCSLLAHAFALVGYPILPDKMRLSLPAAADHRNLTPSDFEHASVFEVVRPMNTVVGRC